MEMNDLISRLSELRCQYNCFDENEQDAYHTLSEAIKALSVGDTISRQAAINVFEERLRANGYSNVALVSEFNRSIGYLMRLPSAQSVQHGHWIYHMSEMFPADSTVECSVCHEHESVLLAHDNYCPNCGAKMDGEEDG